MRTKTFLSCGALLACVLPGIATAHPGHEAGADLAAGLLHPLAGFDHLAALLATGLLAGRMGGRAGMGIALSFLILLGAGVLIGFTGIELPWTETLILASVACVALLAWRPPRHLPVATATLAAAFALFHGYAHGAEAANGAQRLAYTAGLLLGSAGVMATGFWLAQARIRGHAPLPHRGR
jgi:urease accessory protein